MSADVKASSSAPTRSATPDYGDKAEHQTYQEPRSLDLHFSLSSFRHVYRHAYDQPRQPPCVRQRKACAF